MKTFKFGDDIEAKVNHQWLPAKYISGDTEGAWVLLTDKEDYLFPLNRSMSNVRVPVKKVRRRMQSYLNTRTNQFSVRECGFRVNELLLKPIGEPFDMEFVYSEDDVK